MMNVADAVHYAHESGTIHRDIKPSNILLDESGTIWVTDFGLAKIDSESDITRIGDLVGTLRYAAPEQLQGAFAPRCDIYSLDATLYELLTLQPAILSVNKLQIIQQVRELDPVPPRQIDPNIPLDLETITLKAMAKEVTNRYSTANELVEDLQRFLEDKPIRARPMSGWERAVRWGNRNRALAASLLAISLGLIVMSIGSSVAAVLFRDLAESEKSSRIQVDRERREAEVAETFMRRRLYASEINQGLQATKFHGGLQKELEYLSHWNSTTGRDDLRGWEWFYLKSVAHQDRMRFEEPDGFESIAASPDGRLVAWTLSNKIVVFDLEKRCSLSEISTAIESTSLLCFDRTGERLVWVGRSGELVVMDIRTKELQFRFVTTAEILSICWHPQNDALVYVVAGPESVGSSLHELDAVSWQSKMVIASELCESACRYSFRPDGECFAICSAKKTGSPESDIQIWSTTTWA